MKIIFVAPKTINKDRYKVSFDYGFWNFYLPLKDLGHEVRFFDTSRRGNEELQKEIDSFKPDLLFCVMTGSPYYCPDEPWGAIEYARRKNIKTFNWFCDDEWRFDDFSSRACFLFDYCSTPEKHFVDRYESIGYKNIMYATWHSNPDFYTGWRDDSQKMLHYASFCGAPHGDRESIIKKCEPHLHIGRNLSFEDMIALYSNSIAGVNFARCSQGGKTQTKARPFEIAATGAMVITDSFTNAYNCFDDSEFWVCDSQYDIPGVIDWVYHNPDEAIGIATRGHAKFLQEHTSQIRMKQVLEFVS